jgi:error-prone DNA polymerase
VDAESADRVFASLQGFAQYGFCKSHAAGFALICYQSAWLKHHYPVEFYCALLNHQPMGFYRPEVVVHDAQRHGIAVLPVDVNRSEVVCRIEAGRIRLGLQYVKEMGPRTLEAILSERQRGEYRSLEDFCLRTGLPEGVVENLVLVGAFDRFGGTRRELLWRLGVVAKRNPGELPLDASGGVVSLTGMTPLEEMRCDYSVQELSTSYHPMQVLRPELRGEPLLRSIELESRSDGEQVKVAGYVIMRQRPPTAKGFAFITMEDESGMINVVIRPDVYERFRQVCIFNPVLLVTGSLQKRDGTLNVRAETIAPLRPGGEPPLSGRAATRRHAPGQNH